MKMTCIEMWNGVAQRKKALDGRFVYAVKTSKIYCRPSCPSRRPNKENVDFFDTSEAARMAGYRACLRCSPDATMSKAEMMIEQVRNYIEQNLDQTLTLEKLGRAVGASPYHLQRVFKVTTGLTPREYADECRLSAVKKGLSSGHQVTKALYEAGYSSSSRFYERSNRELGMTPRSYAKRGEGELINCVFVYSQLGLLLMAATTRGLCFLQFGISEDELMEALQVEFKAATIIENAEPLSVWIDPLCEYLAGYAVNLNIPVDVTGTSFQLSVWRYLRQIPRGETRTYSDVANAIGQPKAVRAAARACASNKVALVIPCHRVIRQDGSLAGYRWGIERKQLLLKQEHLEPNK